MLNNSDKENAQRTIVKNFMKDKFNLRKVTFANNPGAHLCYSVIRLYFCESKKMDVEHSINTNVSLLE